MRALLAPLLLLPLLALGKVEKPVTKLQIGVLHKPENCAEMPKAKSGDMVSVHYTGKLIDGTVFDSSVERNDPITFTLGVGQVIKGWDDGIKGMCVGEKRKLKIPSDLGYGDGGSPPKIPGGSTLIFTTGE